MIDWVKLREYAINLDTLLPSGPSSALLTLAQMRGKPALMVVAWQELDTVDSLAMEVRGFQYVALKED